MAQIRSLAQELLYAAGAAKKKKKKKKRQKKNTNIVAKQYVTKHPRSH